jgi:hypothetical protein
MYSYVGAGTAGAGLPSKKRLQVSQAISGPNGIATQTLDLDAAYTYNNEGAVPSTTYPSIYPNGVNGSPVAGPVNTYTSFDGMNRPIALNTTTVNGVSYGPSNELLAVTYNSIAETRTYNTLLQLTAVTATLGVNYVNMQYNYPAPGSNNGKACLATDLVTGEQIAYGYDSLNRLATANAYTFSGTPSTNCSSTSSTSTWSETYSFDGYGNLSNKAGTGGAPSMAIGYNGANNQIGIAGAQYDANGNLTANGSGGSYSYDAENRMSFFSSSGSGSLTFAYDSQNKRILNWTGSTDKNGNASGYTIYYYGVKGERLGVYNFVVG